MSDEALLMPASTIIGIDGRPISTAPRWFDDEDECRKEIFDMLGPLDDIEILFNQVLVAKYIRQEVASGILAAEVTQNEDAWQGKVGLVLKLGKTAFQDDEHTKFNGTKVEVGDWVAYRSQDGWDNNIFVLNSRTKMVKCRFIADAHISCRVKFPGRLY